jgi:hypothetical protein
MSMAKFGGKQPKPLRHSKVSSGSKLLPNVHEQSVWGRLFRDRYEGVMSHLGGKSEASELEHMVARRVALLDTELTYLDDKFGKLRAADEEPTPGDLDLYSRLTNTHRRQCEALGWKRRAKDVTPDLAKYIDAHAIEDTG